MRGKTVFLVVAVSSVLMAMWPDAVLAHVTLYDVDNHASAFVHMGENDDPVAGQPTDINYVVTLPEGLTAETATLTIATAGQPAKAVGAQVSGRDITAVYTFPYQAAYTMTLKVLARGKTFTFFCPHRVELGVAAPVKATKQSALSWYEISGLAIVWLGVMVYLLRTTKQRRKPAGGQP